MEEDIKNCIDNKFDKIIKTLKWIGTLLVVILVAFGGIIGANTVRSVKNKASIDRYEIAVREMVTKQQLGRIVEFSKIRKELVMAALAGHTEEDIKLLWKKLEDLETFVIEDDYGQYYRSAQDEDYREKVRKQYD